MISVATACTDISNCLPVLLEIRVHLDESSGALKDRHDTAHLPTNVVLSIANIVVKDMESCRRLTIVLAAHIFSHSLVM